MASATARPGFKVIPLHFEVPDGLEGKELIAYIKKQLDKGDYIQLRPSRHFDDTYYSPQGAAPT